MSSFGNDIVTNSVQSDSVTVRVLKKNLQTGNGGRIELLDGAQNLIKLENLPIDRTIIEVGCIYNDSGTLKIKI